MQTCSIIQAPLFDAKPALLVLAEQHEQSGCGQNNRWPSGGESGETCSLFHKVTMETRQKTTQTALIHLTTVSPVPRPKC